MANYCNCILEVTGTESALDRFVESNRSAQDGDSSPLSFERQVPTRSEMLDGDNGRMATQAAGDLLPLLGRPRDDPFPDWYKSRVANWGTKWDAMSPILVRYADHLRYEFGTATSPPIPWFIATAKAYPDLRLTLTYDELMNSVFGMAVAHDGAVVLHQVIDDNSADQEAFWTRWDAHERLLEW